MEIIESTNITGECQMPEGVELDEVSALQTAGEGSVAGAGKNKYRSQAPQDRGENDKTITASKQSGFWQKTVPPRKDDDGRDSIAGDFANLRVTPMK
jgi:hypothetical protein